MQLVTISAAVLNQTPLDWPGNQARILRAIELARADGAAILCLPELCITGYGCEDAFHSPGVWRAAWDSLAEIVPATRGMIVSVGLPLSHHHGIYNSACLIADGKIVGFKAKNYLAGDGVHYEPRWFKPWPTNQVATFRPAFDPASEDGGATYPLGDVYFDCGGVKIGFEICEDAWVADRPGSSLALKGVDVILNPSASHFAFDKIDIRRQFVVEGSRAFSAAYVYANLLGNEAGRVLFDGGALIASGGRLVAEGPRFTYDDVRVTSAVVDVDVNRLNHARTGSFQPDVGDGPPCRVWTAFEFEEDRSGVIRPPSLPTSETRPAWEQGPHRKEEEFYRAMTVGLFDYLRKSRSHGFIVSLSGGADSTAVSCLVALAVERGLDEIGRARFVDKLAYIPGIAACDDARAFVRRLLACVYQSTRNSGDVTRNAARTVADRIGAEYFEFDVDALVQGYVATVSKALGREISWKTDDVALQNIQARVRSPGIWMLANIRNALLLATSNRSEAAVGYATMDGDTSGGLSPIAGIDKNFLRGWLRWLETTGPEGLEPWPELAAVTKQAPTAELRPPERKQTDEDDLMPYDLLDAVERAAIRDKLTPVEIYRVMRGRFPQHAPQQLGVWIERFFKLWCRNQWKRERYAPSFHLDDENLDPKTWCRFPILSSGYERELAELREVVLVDGGG
jgi:NAD+ synthase (glutamine-hydrolysing)